MKLKSDHSMRMKHNFTQNYRLSENQFDLEISEEIRAGQITQLM